MIKLLKIEFLKIRSYPVFWVIFSLIVVLVAIASIGAANLDFKFGLFSDTADIDATNFFKFPHIWGTFAWIAGWLSHFWAFLLIILVGNEFNYRMFRQQHVYGLQRKELMFSKTILMLVLPIIIVVLLIILGLVFGFKYTEDAAFSDIFANFYFILMYYIQSIAYMSLAALIVYLIGSTGLSLVVYVGYLIFEGIFRFLLRLQEMESIIHYFPLKALSSLTPRPSIQIAMSDMLQKQIPFKDDTSPLSLFLTIALGLGYLGFFWFFSYWLVKKKDL